MLSYLITVVVVVVADLCRLVFMVVALPSEYLRAPVFCKEEDDDDDIEKNAETDMENDDEELDEQDDEEQEEKKETDHSRPRGAVDEVRTIRTDHRPEEHEEEQDEDTTQF